MSKYYRDGKVAVLVSKGYGQAWSNNGRLNRYIPRQELLFNPVLVKLVLEKNEIEERDRHEKTEEGLKQIEEKIKEIKFAALLLCKTGVDDNFDAGGAEGLYVEWVTEGTYFKIVSIDGWEDLVRLSVDGYILA